MTYVKKEDFNMDYMVNATMHGTGDSDAHIMTLFSLALSLKPRSIIELGVRDGFTTVPLLLAAKKLGVQLHSVDINQPRFEVPDNLKPNWSFYKSDAIAFLNGLDKNNTIDFIYIDDWHAYEHVAEELRIIKPLVTSSSVILLHDLMYGNWEPKYRSDVTVAQGQWAGGGPCRAVQELDKDYWEFVTIPCCNGLTILRDKASALKSE